MTRRDAGGFLLLVLAFTAASWVAWWMVPVAALLWGALRPSVRRPTAAASLAAALAAIVWLTVNGAVGGRSLSILADRVARLMSIPVAVLLVVTILLPALLAWSGAVVGSALRPSPADRLPQPNP